jgi:squalene-hopene/tetraprenyl-beta-curcumene cyclase
VERGLAFISAMRMSPTHGHPVQSCCNSEIWDSCAAAAVLLRAGVPPPRFRTEALVESVLRQQKADGVWSFGAGGAEGDLDSSTAVASLLADLHSLVSSSLAQRIERALTPCLEALLAGQQDDGGWGYSPSPHRAPYGFGRRVPGALESGLIDASTPDVTARVVTTLKAVRTLDGWSMPQQEAIARALGHAVAYFGKTQTSFGGWWSRWSAGYLSGTMFVLDALAGGPSLTPVKAEKARQFVLSRQNADGGWGEVTTADVDSRHAGRGPSTPVQTAYGLLALMSGPRTARVEPALRQGLEYLRASQRDGTWVNGRALFTHAFREDYYESALLTHCMIVDALAEEQRQEEDARALAKND